MANPNIVNVTAIHGETGVEKLGTANSDLVANTTSSGKVIKCNALYLCNLDGSNAINVTVLINRGGTAYAFANNLEIPAGASFDVFSKSVYLQEGDKIEARAATASMIDSVISYEVIDSAA